MSGTRGSGTIVYQGRFGQGGGLYQDHPGHRDQVRQGGRVGQQCRGAGDGEYREHVPGAVRQGDECQHEVSLPPHHDSGPSSGGDQGEHRQCLQCKWNQIFSRYNY